jgi:hypothetical protein
MGIAYQNPAYRAWTPAEDKLLGTLSDREVAGQMGRTFAAVRARRIEYGLKDPSAREPWKKSEEDRLLGTAPDDEIAKRTGRTLSAVKTRRKHLKILAYSAPIR